MRLTDYFIKLIVYVAYFLKTVATKHPPFDQVKADIQRLISESEEWLKKGAFSREDYDVARFAIFAWVDEAILSSSWKEKDRWQGEQLQRIYYHTADAGEIFYERLNAIGPHQREVRETYYLCLAMGFVGRYCHEGDDYHLEQLKTSNLKLLMGSSVGLPSIEKGELFPEAYPVESGEIAPQSAQIRFSAFALFCVGFPVVFYWILFLIYRFILDRYGEVIIGTVH